MSYLEKTEYIINCAKQKVESGIETGMNIGADGRRDTFFAKSTDLDIETQATTEEEAKDLLRMDIDHYLRLHLSVAKEIVGII